MKKRDLKKLVGKIAITHEGDRHLITDYHHHGYVMINGVWKGWFAIAKDYKITEALGVDEEGLKEMMINGFFTIEQAAMICHLNGSDLIFNIKQTESNCLTVP